MPDHKRTVSVEHPKNAIFELVLTVTGERLTNGTLDCYSEVVTRCRRGKADVRTAEADMIRAAIADLQGALETGGYGDA